MKDILDGILWGAALGIAFAGVITSIAYMLF